VENSVLCKEGNGHMLVMEVVGRSKIFVVIFKQVLCNFNTEPYKQ